jgi:hypothetical protein
MIPFSKRFPELGPQETRVLCFEEDGEFPRGRYALAESYCEEANCDCRRVLLTVVEESTPDKVWASISYSWDPPAGFSAESKEEALGATPSGAFLDPLYPQSEPAAEFLDLFEWMIARDPAYVERLKRHYAMFKAALSATERSGLLPHSKTRAMRPKAELLKKRQKRR